MTREDAGRLVDEWVREWKLYLDGPLHKKAREGLIDKLCGLPAEPQKRGRGSK